MCKQLRMLAGVVVVLLSGVWLCAQDAGQIVKLDPALDAIVSAGARVEKVADGFGFLEGPVWVHSSTPGYLLFSDIPRTPSISGAPAPRLRSFWPRAGLPDQILRTSATKSITATQKSR